MSHTPGPWKVGKELCSYAGVWLISMDFGDGSRGSGIARTCAEAFDGDPKSNAHRIAALWNMAERLGLSTEEIESGNVETKLKAAPDMLEALETIMDIGDKACRDIARAAIRKARGEA